MTRSIYHSRVPSPRLCVRPRGAFLGAPVVSVFRGTVAIDGGSDAGEGRSP